MTIRAWLRTSLVLLLGLPVMAVDGVKPSGPDLAAILREYRTSYQQIASEKRSTLHWGRLVSIWVSRDADRYRDNVRRNLAERAGEEIDAFAKYEPGTVVVKEHRIAAGAAPDGWSLMIRQQEAAPIGGPWRYIELDAEGRVLIDGTGSDPQALARCAVCHQQIGARDFLFHTFVDAHAVDGRP
jgi:hypothetical protein